MTRLIDSDLLKKNCKCTGEFEDNFKCVSLSELAKVIDKQPTAFDVDKIIRQLKEIRQKEYTACSDQKCECCRYFVTCSYGDKADKLALDRAIEIVKGGGVV